MKKRIYIILVVFLVVIGGYYAYKTNTLKNTKQSSSKVSVDKNTKSNETPKNPTNEKLKQLVLDKVSKAEASKTQADIDEARKAVDALASGSDKDSLNKKLDKIVAVDNKANTNTVAWVKTPEYNGIRTAIDGAVDNKNVKLVKAFVEDKEIPVTLNNDGTFIIDCGNVDSGKIVKVKAYDKDNKEVTSRDVIRAL